MIATSIKQHLFSASWNFLQFKSTFATAEKGAAEILNQREKKNISGRGAQHI